MQRGSSSSVIKPTMPACLLRAVFRASWIALQVGSERKKKNKLLKVNQSL
jgi:hypothetical protein